MSIAPLQDHALQGNGLGVPQRNRISVVIPCHNDGAYLARTLRTVFSQTRRPDEVLVVDDGSTDRRTLQFLALPAPGLRVLRQENQGPGAARNTGVRNTTGEFVALLDSDDLLRPTAFARMEAALEGNPAASFVYSQVECFGSRKEVVVIPRLNPYLELEVNHAVMMSLIRRSVFEQTGLSYPTMRGYEDWAFWVSCVEAGLTGEVIDEPLYRYRIKSNSGVNWAADARGEELRAEIRRRHPNLYSAGGRAALKALHAPGLQLIWSGDAAGASRLRSFLKGQSLRDVALTCATFQDARALLSKAKGKYLATVSELQLAALEGAAPSFLKELLSWCETNPGLDAVIVRARVAPPVKVKLPGIRTVSVSPDDVVLIRLARAAHFTTADLPTDAVPWALSQRVLDTLRVAHFPETTTRVPSRAAIGVRRGSRVRALLAAAMGEERTARLLHPFKKRMLALGQRVRGEPLLPPSQREERRLLDLLPIGLPPD